MINLKLVLAAAKHAHKIEAKRRKNIKESDYFTQINRSLVFCRVIHFLLFDFFLCRIRCRRQHRFVRFFFFGGGSIFFYLSRAKRNNKEKNASKLLSTMDRQYMPVSNLGSMGIMF